MAPPSGDGPPVLPRHLADHRGLSAAEFVVFNREKREWLIRHGINPGDWSAVYPVLKASWQAHNIPRPSRLIVKDEA